MPWSEPKTNWGASSVPTEEDFNRIENNIKDLRSSKEPVISVLPIEKGGTGATTEEAARTNLGLGAAATYGVTDSTSSSAIVNNANKLVTERDVYYGLPYINGDHTYSSNTTFFAPQSGGVVGQILVSDGNKDPVWNSGSIVSGSVTNKNSIGNSAKIRFITVWAEETKGYGHIALHKTTYRGDTVAYAHGDDGYWGKSGLCVSACFPKGVSCIVTAENVGTMSYSCMELG